jgi:hypothetical protein
LLDDETETVDAARSFRLPSDQLPNFNIGPKSHFHNRIQCRGIAGTMVSNLPSMTDPI